jgi:hypothetical protein
MFVQQAPLQHIHRSMRHVPFILCPHCLQRQSNCHTAGSPEGSKPGMKCFLDLLANPYPLSIEEQREGKKLFPQTQLIHVRTRETLIMRH